MTAVISAIRYHSSVNYLNPLAQYGAGSELNWVPGPMSGAAAEAAVSDRTFYARNTHMRRTDERALAGGGDSAAAATAAAAAAADAWMRAWFILQGCW